MAQARNREEGRGTAARIRLYLDRYPHLAEKIYRQILISLHNRECIRAEDLALKARRTVKEEEVLSSQNRGTGSPWKRDDREVIRSMILEAAETYCTPEEIDDLVNVTLKREKAEDLEDLVDLKEVPFTELRRRVKAFCRIPRGSQRLSEAEVMGLRVALIRQVISDNLEFIGVAKHYIGLRDMEGLLDATVAPPRGEGRIGGKAAGMFLAHHILCGEFSKDADPELGLKIPESLYLRTDVYTAFFKKNGLTEYYDQKYKPLEEIASDYPFVREIFKNAAFPDYVTSALKDFLDAVGEHPLIVRSSSLLEDRRGSAFSGKYDSLFVPNQGPLETRLRDLQGAVAQVYASTLGPNPIDYRMRRNLIDYDEKMGVLIQKVVGRRHGKYFFPLFGGVAFSRNEYRWSPRIRREDGLVRVVAGLGTRAVDRVGDDYPRMIALTAPTLRPQASNQDVCKYSQRYLDVINLETNRLETVSLRDALGARGPFPGLDRVVSVFREGSLAPPVGTLIDADPDALVITFQKLAASTDVPRKIGKMLTILEAAYECPVDVEFAHDGEDLYLLQCRPLAKRIEFERVRVPDDVPEDDRLFTARVDVPNASVHDIAYVVYVDPRAYDAIEGTRMRREVGRAVNAVNHALENERFILMGPGRWGSNDLRLGVPVRYGDIHNTLVLIEIAFLRGDQVPEVSFGTHFFQDLVEAGIHHLPLYPDDPAVRFRESFFAESPNRLGGIAPAFAGLGDVLRVIHVPGETGGRALHLDMDGEEERALGYLK